MAPRDRTLALLQRYRLLTRALVARFVYPERQGSALKAALGNLLSRDLTKKGLIASEQAGDLLYYRLTPRGASETGAPASYAKALGPRELFEAFGELMFSCGSDTPRPKFIRTEFEHYFPNRPMAAWVPRFYLDVEGEFRRLGRIAVLFPRADAAAEVVKAIRDIRALGEDFLAEGRAAVALVCATTAQAAKLMEAPPSHPQGVRLVVVHQAELAPLVSLIEPIRGRGKSASPSEAS